MVQQDQVVPVNGQLWSSANGPLAAQAILDDIEAALLPQETVAPEGLTVTELIRFGRQPHQGWLRQWSAKDQRVVQRALAAAGLEQLADRPIEALSGGQRQRAWIATSVDREAERLRHASEAYVDANRKAIQVSSAFIPIIRMAILAGFLATFTVGGMMALNGSLNVGAPAASANDFRWREHCSKTRQFWCWTKPPARWTTKPKRPFSAR